MTPETDTLKGWLNKNRDASPTILLTLGGNAFPVMLPDPIVVPPIDPPNVTRIGSTHPVQSIDSTDLDAHANWIYLIDSDIAASKPQRINKSGITIMGDTPNRKIDCGVKWEEALITFTAKSIGSAVRSLTVIGHDGGELVNLQGAASFQLTDVHQDVHPQHHGGVSLLTARNSIKFLADGCTSVRTARYSIYLGGDNSDSDIVRNCNFGPTAITEDENSSGLAAFKKAHPDKLHGATWNEHPLRVYNFKNLVVENNVFNNPHAPGGKNSVKLMNGDGFVFRNNKCFGIPRFGPDVNDPKTYTLKNGVISGSEFDGTVRIDTRADVTIRDSTMGALDVQPGGIARLDNATVGGKVRSGPVKG